MAKFDKYIWTNETPKDLCKEIDCLKEVVNRQKELISTLEEKNNILQKLLKIKEDFTGEEIK